VKGGVDKFIEQSKMPAIFPVILGA